MDSDYVSPPESLYEEAAGDSDVDDDYLPDEQDDIVERSVAADPQMTGDFE